MPPRQRNVIVGIVVLVGLGVVVWMLLLFAGRLASVFAAPGLPVTFTADRADGVTNGSAIYYLGVQVGRVTEIHRGADNQSVVINAEVNKEPPLPADLVGVIKTQSAFGNTAMITLELTGPPTGALSSGATLHAQYEGSGLLPPAVTQLAEDLRRQQLIQHLDQTIITIREQAERAGQVLQSFQGVVGDPKLREDLRASMSNIRQATESATHVGSDLQKFTGDLRHVSDQTNSAMSDVRVAVARLSDVLGRFESVADKVDQGKGTAGMLVNDPKLYQGLVDTTRELNATIKDLQRVVQQWEQEGVTLKLGK